MLDVDPTGALRFDIAGLGLAELNFNEGLIDVGSGRDPSLEVDTERSLFGAGLGGGGCLGGGGNSSAQLGIRCC